MRDYYRLLYLPLKWFDDRVKISYIFSNWHKEIIAGIHPKNSQIYNVISRTCGRYTCEKQVALLKRYNTNYFVLANSSNLCLFRCYSLNSVDVFSTNIMETYFTMIIRISD